jgi:hypothetical protein
MNFEIPKQYKNITHEQTVTTYLFGIYCVERFTFLC